MKLSKNSKELREFDEQGVSDFLYVPEVVIAPKKKKVAKVEEPKPAPIVVKPKKKVKKVVLAKPVIKIVQKPKVYVSQFEKALSKLDKSTLESVLVNLDLMKKEPLFKSKNKDIVTALREIAAEKVKHAPVSEYDSDEF